MLRQGVPGGTRPRLSTHDYQVRGPSRGAGWCLRSQEGGPPARVEVEIPSPPAQGEGAAAPEALEREAPVAQEGVGKGEVGVEVEIEPRAEEMEE